MNADKLYIREMGLKVAEGKTLAKKEIWPSEGRNQRSMKSDLVEAISLVKGGVVSHTNEDGVVRMKIVLKKEDLKHVIEVMRGSENVAHGPTMLTSSPVERRLNLLKRRHLLRVNASKESRRSANWLPVLQSIPEEL